MKTTLKFKYLGDASTPTAGNDLTALMHQLNKLMPTAPNAIEAIVPPRHESECDFIVTIMARDFSTMLYRYDLVKRRCNFMNLEDIHLVADKPEAEEYSKMLSVLHMEYVHANVKLTYELREPRYAAAAKCG